MIPFEPIIEAREKIWSQLSQCDGEFVIFLGRFHIHTIEAPVAVKKQERMDEIEYFILRAINILDSADIEKINNVLHIGRQILRQIITKLIKNNLIQAHTDGTFDVTFLGKKVLDTGEMILLKNDRRIFHFIDANKEFIPMENAANKFLVNLACHETEVDWNFDIECLRDCIDANEHWKRRRKFPMDVHEIITSDYGTGVENTLVIDKAQVINCAILVKFRSDNPLELHAYPISPTGHLLAMDAMFSFTDEEAISSVFGFVNELPDDRQLYPAFVSLGQKYMLNGIEKIPVSGRKTNAIIEVKEDDNLSWARFYWDNMLGKIFCDTVSKGVVRMARLHFNNKSSSLQTVCCLFEIYQSYLSEDNLRDISSYNTWLSEKPHFAGVSLRKLAGLAWELDNYRLAYKLAQLEDMADAPV